MNAFTIRDLENLSGIKAHTIRIWEQRYHFLKPKRTGTNIRFYSSDELKHLLNIALLNRYGFKISRIDKMCAEEISQHILNLPAQQASQDRMVIDLIQLMVDMDNAAFEEKLDAHIALHGIDKTILHVIFPFLEKTGLLWLTSHIQPAQEHLVSNLIRQKLIHGIESSFPHIRVNKTALLFLPEGEHHEIGLLYASYLMKSHGLQIVYLGADCSFDALQYTAQVKNADLYYTHLTAVSNNFNFEKFVLRFSTGNIPFYLSGAIVQSYKKKPPANIHFIHSLTEFLQLLSALR